MATITRRKVKLNNASWKLSKFFCVQNLILCTPFAGFPFYRKTGSPLIGSCYVAFVRSPPVFRFAEHGESLERFHANRGWVLFFGQSKKKPIVILGGQSRDFLERNEFAYRNRGTWTQNVCRIDIRKELREWFCSEERNDRSLRFQAFFLPLSNFLLNHSFSNISKNNCTLHRS